MPTEQSYVGGDSHAKHPELTVENTVQVGSQAPQAPSQVPDSASSATSNGTEAPKSSSPPVSPQIVRGDEEPLLVPLTSYFCKVTSSRANVIAFRELLHNVFFHYATSPEFMHREQVEGINEISILKSFYAGIAVFVERTTDYRLGTRIPLDPGPLPGEAEQPDPIVDPAAYVSYGGDVLTVTDVATLQGWVSMLQTKNEITVIRLEKEAQALRGEIEELRSKLELESERLLIANRKIAELESRPVPVATPPAKKPRIADYGVGMLLSLGHSYSSTSEAQLVQYALRQYHTATMKLGFNAIAEGEYHNAFAQFQDANVITQLLDELTEGLIAVGLNNLSIAVGSSKPDEYDEEFEDFMTQYLPGISA